MNIYLDSYKEGLDRLKKLETEENVLTLESEEEIADVQRKMEIAVKQKHLQKQSLKMKAKFLAAANPPNEKTDLQANGKKTMHYLN